MLKVDLIAYTPNPEMIISAAAKLCYSEKDATDLLNDLTPEKIEKFVSKLSSMGHQSPFEHATFTFSISGVSRTLLAQLTRHRIASFSVRSQRYVNESDFEFIIPPAIESNPDAKRVYLDTMKTIRDAYDNIMAILHYDSYDYTDSKEERQRKTKAIQEDARYVLPNATETKLVMTMNARELLHFFHLRCCNRAQWEIRDLAYEMLRQCYQIAPNIFKYAGPPCYHGICNEGAMNCGNQSESMRRGDSIRGIGC